jgi:hypothetical protein
MFILCCIREKRVLTDISQAFESVGLGHWEGHTAAVPTTEKGELFGGWDEVDPERPILPRDRGSDETLVGGLDERQSLVKIEEDLERRSTTIVVHEVGHAY